MKTTKENDVNKIKGALSYKYLGYITNIYTHLTSKYPGYSVYFSEYLKAPSVCLETKTDKFEWHVGENEIQNNELWIYHGQEKLKSYEGSGFGEKIDNVIDQVESFLNGFLSKEKAQEKQQEKKAAYTQLTIFDFI